MKDWIASGLQRSSSANRTDRPDVKSELVYGSKLRIERVLPKITETSKPIDSSGTRFTPVHGDKDASAYSRNKERKMERLIVKCRFFAEAPGWVCATNGPNR
jgi:hypothetical protein